MIDKKEELRSTLLFSFSSFSPTKSRQDNDNKTLKKNRPEKKISDKKMFSDDVTTRVMMAFYEWTWVGLNSDILQLLYISNNFASKIGRHTVCI